MLKLANITGVRRLLCVGAHSDDIEIGCGGTVLRLIAENPALAVRWVVFSADAQREAEARASAAQFCAGAASVEVIVHRFRDGFLPYVGGEVKEAFESLKVGFAPDLVLTHCRDDQHQDHALLARLAWNTFRDHLILAYEIPKYDGDLGQPGFFVHLDEPTCRRKVELLCASFPSQAQKPWFTPDTFWATLRLRGLESNAPGRFAEGFHCRKFVV